MAFFFIWFERNRECNGKINRSFVKTQGGVDG